MLRFAAENELEEEAGGAYDARLNDKYAMYTSLNLFCCDGICEKATGQGEGSGIS